jgi:hypothetical protein
MMNPLRPSRHRAPMTCGPRSSDRELTGAWRVEKMDADGGYECVEVFAGSNGRQRAIAYAGHRFGVFDEIELASYPR